MDSISGIQDLAASTRGESGARRRSLGEAPPHRSALQIFVASTFALAATLAFAGEAWSQPTSEELDQRIRILERQLEIQKEEAETKAKDATSTSFGDRGLSVKKGDYEFRLRAMAHSDLRFFLDDSEPRFNDTSILRRLRPNFEFNAGKLVSFRLQPEFAGDSTTIVDAHVDLKLNPAFNIRAGRQKGPVGLERLVSASAMEFVERGFATELAPNRDLGVLFHGAVLNSTLSYGVGAFNGSPDGRDAPTTNPDNRFEIAGRIFAEPFKNDIGVLQGLGFGIAGSSGTKDGTGNNFLPRYRSAGQNVFFQYAGAVAADGDHNRISPQAYWYNGQLGLLGEWISSEQDVVLGADSASLEHTAWQVYGTYVLTGEDAGYGGVAKPANPFEIGKPGWGAFELAARFGKLEIDDDAFPIFASEATAAREATSYTFGVNWYLTRNAKLVLNYSETSYDGGAATGDRQNEKAVFTRFQVAL